MSRLFHRLLKINSLFVSAALILSACGSGKSNMPTYVVLTPANPVVQIPEGLTLSTNPTTLPPDFGVQLQAISADTFNDSTNAHWQTALAALPANLHLTGPLYEIKTSGQSPAQLFLSVILPPNADPASLDLYGWDDQTWAFVPAHPRGNQLVAEVTHIPAALGLFETAPLPPLALTTLEPGQTLNAAAVTAVNGVLLGGVRIQSNGAVTGQLPNAIFDPSLSVYPVVCNYDAYGPDIAGLSALLVDVAVRANHLQSLVAFAASGPYAGLVLDYHGLNDALAAPYATFVRDLAARLHAQNRQLFVSVAAPTQSNGNFTSSGYDLRALSTAADALLLPLPADPQALTNGSADSLLTWIVGEVDRTRLRLLTSALSVDALAGRFTLLDQATALADFGSPALSPTPTADIVTSLPVTVTLSGSTQSLDYDSAAFAVRYTYLDNAKSEHTVWLTSADTVRQRLALAKKYGLGGVLVTDLLAPGVPDNLAAAITQYKVNLPAEGSSTASLLWTVGDGVTVVAQATAQPNAPFAFTPEKPGDYKISAELQIASAHPLGAVDVKVVKATASHPSSGGSSSGSSGATGGGSSGGSSNTGGSTGGFVPPPPIAAGNFSLGGQVSSFIGHPDIMRQAGMTWVKMQATDPAGSIAAGHAAGFKVLISAVGDRSRAADPAYWPEYAQWVAGIAAMGADAIEVWNEANLDREWPNGQISGTNYTEMLKQAYAAIKAANPGTLVIGGAPSPTGAAGAAGCTAAFCNDDVFLSQMAAAGAANYMDCMGVHFNSGTTSPRVTTGANLSGYHYSYYFWPMVDLYYNTFGGARPLCFTELGYMSPEGYDSTSLGIFQWAAGITVAQQAQWLAEAASLSASSGKVKMMIIFNVDFTVMLTNDPQAGYAILRPDGSCPACASLDAVMP